MALNIEYVMINPSNGVGTAVDPGYTRLVQQWLPSTNIKVLGYITCDEQRVTKEEVLASAQKYLDFYGDTYIHGFFIDEYMLQTETQLKYHQELYSALKAKFPTKTIVGNPGIHMLVDGINTADILCLFENTADVYINSYEEPTVTSETDKANRSKVYHLIHTATSDQYDKIIELAKKRNVGYLFITSDVMPNPWDGEPDDFINLINKITS